MGRIERLIDHDAAPGPLTRCQITGSENLHCVLDLGHQPPCDALVTDPNAPETTYPLRLMFCPDSGLAQLDYVVPGAEIYPPSYPYRAGISWPVREYQAEFAVDLARRFELAGNALVVDVGSNDGTLLKALQRFDVRALGVEPTDVAAIARANGVATRQAFFSEVLAREIFAENGPAKLITMTNVFAHMADLGEVMRGLVALLAEDGVFVTESHYLLDVLEKNQFDTVYHEHIRTYSLKALTLLFPQYGLEVFDAGRCGRYGGNLRVYVARAGTRPVDAGVGELLRREDNAGLHTLDAWRKFRERVLQGRDVFMNWLHSAHLSGARVAGCSAPGRASTLLNFYGVSPDLMAYTGELQDSLKLGKFIPGCHIPIVDNRRLVNDQPSHVVLLAWHYAEAIAPRLRREGVRGSLIVPLPGFHTV